MEPTTSTSLVAISHENDKSESEVKFHEAVCLRLPTNMGVVRRMRKGRGRAVIAETKDLATQLSKHFYN